MGKLEKYTGKFQALWDLYLLLKEAHKHRKNTIGLESTPKDKRIMKEHVRSGLRIRTEIKNKTNLLTLSLSMTSSNKAKNFKNLYS